MKEKIFLKIKKIEKRKRCIISTLVLTFFLLIATFLSLKHLFPFLFFIGILTYGLTFFSVFEGIRKGEWLTLFIMPVFFTLSFLLFYFLLPVRWLTRLPFILLYAISIYALFLSSNIFNVGVEKSLQLFRAAYSVNFLFSTLTSFFIYSLILSFRLSFILNFFLSFFFTFPLSLQILWSVEPKEVIKRKIINYAFLVSFIIGELAWIFSFAPLRINVLALFLTTSYYCLLGLFQAYLEERLFKERIREYVFVFIVVFLLTVFSISW